MSSLRIRRIGTSTMSADKPCERCNAKLIPNYMEGNYLHPLEGKCVFAGKSTEDWDTSLTETFLRKGLGEETRCPISRQSSASYEEEKLKKLEQKLAR